MSYELIEKLEEVWDDGNAVGLDGWIGPGRGAGEVDSEAVRCRERATLKASEAIFAAGYRKQRTISTVEELDALADGTAVLDADADVSTKHGGRWHGYEMSPLDSRKFSKCGPFAVLHEPEAKL
ncbi:hypothetical protein SEA_PEGGYLEG03_56 [Arthrobacter phage PeggyLeg03]|nr:hypothetical protein SEA_PEGGYLEG03_56 [Arthrobacter phage PeggyLeg03]